MTYHSLSDYALVGNGASAALVNRSGSIDWCAFPYLDSPSHFGSLIDESQGGKFQIAPVGDFRSEQRYLQRTHVLETLFETPYGRAILTDWMPMEKDEPILHRVLEMLEGKITWALTCAPRFLYGGSTSQAERNDGGVLFRGSAPDELARLTSSANLEISPDGSTASARFELESAGRAWFTWAWGRRPRVRPGDPLAGAGPSAESSIEGWRELAHRCPATGCVFAGPWHDTVARAGLALRLLITPYSGSIAESAATFPSSIQAAATVGSARVASVRNSAYALQALLSLGLEREARDHFDWISQMLIRDRAESLQASYTLDGGPFVGERELGLGAGARPTRYAGYAHRRFQLDVYGHALLAAAYAHRAFGESWELSPDLWPALAEIADFVCQAWKRPDFASQEMRTRAEHFVVSKALCWAALESACYLAEATGQEGSPRWASERENLHRTICDQGYDPARQSFVRAFGDPELDASTLAIPLMGFLPTDDFRIQGTLSAVQDRLAEGVLIYRTRSEGHPGAELANIELSLSFISALALSGRADEATDRLAELCTYATPLGLLGEHINPRTGEMSGNFPSASTLLALINAGLYVGIARGRKVDLPWIIGREPLIANKKDLKKTRKKSA